MRKLTNIGCTTVLAIMVIVLAVAAVQSWSNAPAPSRPTAARASKNNVILRAAPGNSMVQMFKSLEEGGPGGVITLPDGFGCYKLSERIAWDEDGGPPMYFYKLNCNGRVGFVNTTWVAAR